MPPKTKVAGNARGVATKRKATRGRAPPSRGEIVKLPEIKFETMMIQVAGTAPLVIHRKGEIMVQAIWNKQRGRPEPPRAKKNPVAAMLDSLYLIDQRDREYLVAVNEKNKVVTDYDGELDMFLPIWATFRKRGRAVKNSGFGFPSAGFREGFFRSTKILEAAAMVDMHSMVKFPETFALIESPEPPQCRFDNAPVQGKADLRFRPHFEEWGCMTSIRFCPQVISQATVLHIFKYAGEFCGLGEMRPEKKIGTFGTYTFDPKTVRVVEEV